jgi:catechol 2,3-dioxygenase-like lactoylglutathione lyase family enzyme
VFDHVTIRVSDRPASRRFYGLALGEPSYEGDEFVEWDAFSIAEDAEPTRRLHVAFGSDEPAAVDAWWRRLVDAGYESDGEPGPRPQYDESYYGAFVLDPDGNSVESVHHDRSLLGGIDHLWLRTRDVSAIKRCYDVLAPLVGIERAHDTPDGVRFRGGGRSFTFVAGDEPTERVHLAFPAPDRATVDEFHRVALAAGYRDNGAPGERPRYHAGYYGAFVLDPDGHNVEAVFHDR